MLLLEGPQNCQFGNHEAGFPPHVLDTLKLKKGNGAARTTTGLWGRACILEFYVASSGPPTVKFKHGYGFGCLRDGNISGSASRACDDKRVPCSPPCVQTATSKLKIWKNDTTHTHHTATPNLKLYSHLSDSDRCEILL